MLSLAEQAYGPRTHQRTFRPVGFHSTSPQIFYPTATELEIRIGLNSQTELERGCYQLSHESVHALSPVDIYTATTLEEGLATSFAHSYIRDHASGEWTHSPTFWSHSGDLRYDLARALVELFLSTRSDAILRLRKRQPVISSISADLISELYPDVEPSVSYALTARFHPQPAA